MVSKSTVRLLTFLLPFLKALSVFQRFFCLSSPLYSLRCRLLDLILNAATATAFDDVTASHLVLAKMKIFLAPILRYVSVTPATFSEGVSRLR